MTKENIKMIDLICLRIINKKELYNYNKHYKNNRFNSFIALTTLNTYNLN